MSALHPKADMCGAVGDVDFGPDMATFLRSVVAIHMPANTAMSPMIRLIVVGSPTNCVASSPAAMKLTVIVFATRVGVAFSSAITQRMVEGAHSHNTRKKTAPRYGYPILHNRMVLS